MEPISSRNFCLSSHAIFHDIEENRPILLDEPMWRMICISSTTFAVFLSEMREITLHLWALSPFSRWFMIVVVAVAFFFDAFLDIWDQCCFWTPVLVRIRFV